MAASRPNHWCTVTELMDGEPITTVFRVRSPDTGAVVDANAFLETLVRPLCDLADSGQLMEAANGGYRALPVDVWCGDAADGSEGGDAQALPADDSTEPAENIVVDLWSPMQLAVVLRQQSAVDRLLRFHEEYGVAILSTLTAAGEFPPGAPSATGVAGVGACSLAQSIDDFSLPRVRSGTDDESGNSGRGGGGPHGLAAVAHSTSRRSASPTPTLTTEEASGRAGAVATAAPVNLFECSVRHDLGNAVVLLGHYEAPVTAGRRSQPRAAPAGLTVAHVEELTGTPRGQPLSAPLPPPPSTEEEAAAARRNAHINDLEQQFLSDAGEGLCVANVMGAIKPLLTRAVDGLKVSVRQKSGERGGDASSENGDPAMAVARFALDSIRQHCASFIDLLRKPAIIADAAMLYEMCDGDMDLLTALVEVFQGSLTPILVGKKFSGAHGGSSGSSANVGAVGSTTPSPALHALNAACTGAASRSSSGMPTPHSQSMARPHSSRGGAAGGSHPVMQGVPTSGPHAGPAPACSGSSSGSSSEPFWLSCAPQEAQRLAFYAAWVNLCEQYGERPGSARQRRVGNLLSEYRMMLSSFKKIRETNYVPNAAIWSGHVVLVSKMLSHDCTVEDFLDIIGEGGYLPALSAASTPGTFVALLAAGTTAAARVADAPALRLLSKKVEALLVEVSGRTSPVRAFLTSRPATHAERFEELWLGTTRYSQPKKFKTRIEMLYFATVELALLAAERAWAVRPDTATDSFAAPAIAATLLDPKKRTEAQAALQAYIGVWRTFLVSTRDRPLHRRSMSRSSVNSSSFAGCATTTDGRVTPRNRPLPESTTGVQSGNAAPAALGTPASQPIGGAGVGGNNSSAAKEVVVETESLAEFAEVVRKVCASLPGRLQHGRDPLPALYNALYPGGQEPDGQGGAASGASSGSGGGGAPGTGASGSGSSANGGASAGGMCPSSLSGAATPAYADKPLPISSLDSEFNYVQRCFADESAKESNEIKLKFYGLFKQATVGDINVSKPWMMDTVGRAKWEAWKKLKGMSLVDAKRMYVNEYKVMKQMRADKEKEAKLR